MADLVITLTFPSDRVAEVREAILFAEPIPAAWAVDKDNPTGPELKAWATELGRRFYRDLARSGLDGLAKLAVAVPPDDTIVTG